MTTLTGSARLERGKARSRPAAKARPTTRRRRRPRADAAPQPSLPAAMVSTAPAIPLTPTPAPESPAADRTFICIDIPLTAGPTLRSVAKGQYGRDELVAVYRPLMEQTLEELRAADERRKARWRFVIGHVNFGVHELLPHRQFAYLTVLRDPVERVIAEYEYIRGAADHFLHREVSRMTLKEFAAAGLSNGSENGQTKYLTRSRWSTRPGSGGAPLADDALEQAQRNLSEHFLVVGVDRELDASLLLMKRALGWKMPFYSAGPAGPLAVGKALRDAAPPDAVEVIEAHNALDIRLYEWARRRFDDAVQRAGLLFQAELRGFQALNSWYSFSRRGGR